MTCPRPALPPRTGLAGSLPPPPAPSAGNRTFLGNAPPRGRPHGVLGGAAPRAASARAGAPRRGRRASRGHPPAGGAHPQEARAGGALQWHREHTAGPRRRRRLRRGHFRRRRSDHRPAAALIQGLRLPAMHWVFFVFFRSCLLTSFLENVQRRQGSPLKTQTPSLKMLKAGDVRARGQRLSENARRYSLVSNREETPGQDVWVVRAVFSPVRGGGQPSQRTGFALLASEPHTLGGLVGAPRAGGPMRRPLPGKASTASCGRARHRAGPSFQPAPMSRVPLLAVSRSALSSR